MSSIESHNTNNICNCPCHDLEYEEMMFSPYYDDSESQESDTLTQNEMMLHEGRKYFGNMLCNVLYYSGILYVFYRRTLINKYMNNKIGYECF